MNEPAKKSFSKVILKDFKIFDLEKVLTTYDFFSEKLGVREPYQFTISLEDGTKENVSRDNLITKVDELHKVGQEIKSLALMMMKYTRTQGNQILSLEVSWLRGTVSINFHIFARDVPDRKIDWAKSVHADLERLINSWGTLGGAEITEDSEYKRSQKNKENTATSNIHITGSNNAVNTGSGSSSLSGHNAGHSLLEKISWVAGIIAAIIAVLIYLGHS